MARDIDHHKSLTGPGAAQTAAQGATWVRPMLSPRWRKVLADLGSHKVRTLLVTLSIFIGIFTIGMVVGAQAILDRELRTGYLNIDPAHAIITTGGVTGYNEDFSLNSAPANQEGFSEELIDAVRRMPEVADAEGRHVFDARVRVGDAWKSIQFTAIDDFADVRVDKIRSVAGAWPPEEHEVLIERSGMGVLGVEIGDTILIELPDGKQREMRVAGVVHDLTQWPTPFLGTVYGYIAFDTLEWMGESRDYNKLMIRVVTNADDKQHNEEVAELVHDKIQKSGLDPSFPQVPTPGEHPLNFMIVALTSLMGLLGVFAIFLGSFLVVNTISALLAQQIKQIGIMKAIGARPRQIIAIYIVLALSFGVLALLPAIPLAQVATQGFARYIAAFLNFDIADAGIPAFVVLIQIGAALLVPMGAAFLPVLTGTRVSVREAFGSDSGLGRSYGSGGIDQLLSRIRGLPRPVLLSLRNTFRRKARVTLTLFTLMVGGAFFISVFSIRASLFLTLEELVESLYGYDVDVFLARSYRDDYLVATAERLPGVVAAEGSVQTSVRRVFPDDRKGLDMQLIAVPPESDTLNPQIVAGRWLQPADENALVISTGMLKDDPDLAVGSKITIEIKDREIVWQVVGIMKALGNSRWAYANQDYYGRAAREIDQASYLRIVAREHTPAFQAQLANRLEKQFKREGIEISYTKTISELSQGDFAAINVITISLMLIAVLVAVVGGLGLAGTMSLNVIERMREIGVMRAIGAEDRALLQVFIVEGMVIGGLSWLIGALLSLPLGKLMSDMLGEQIFSSPLSFSPSLTGALLWLALSLAISALASLWPAWNATRIPVHDVLAYE